MSIAQLQLSLARPMRRLRRQIPLLDRALGVSLSAQEFEAVREACARSRVEFGAFYHWYLQKVLMANCVRKLDRESMLNAIGRMDRTDYAPLDAASSDPRGLLIAIPHHGHYIFSIVAMMERLRARREVFVFYGSPKTHAGNELFDRLYACLWGGDPQSRAHVIHDTRSGMAQALRGLHNGAAVIIMPDVFKQEDDTFLLPFCGRPLNVMLGTAVLARKTGSWILSAVSRPSPNSLCIQTAFSSCIETGGDAEAPARGEMDTLHQDYRATVRMFRFFEQAMGDEVVHWQYARSHYARKAAFPELDPTSLETVAGLLFRDPRVNVETRHPIRLG